MFLRSVVPGLSVVRRAVANTNRRPRTYCFASLSECRKHFAKSMKTDLAWDDQEEWEGELGVM
jgi:hypothetical protein